MDAKLEAVNYILETHILFNALPARDKRFLATLFEMRSCEEGEVVAEQGAPIDAMLFVYAGQVRLKKTSQGKRASLGVLGKESTLGESCLLKAGEWPYQVVSEEKSTIFLLPGEKLRQVVANNREMETVFKREIGYISLAQRLRGMLGEAEYTPQQFSEILHNFGIKNIAKGANVYKQGDKDPRLYYIEKGSVELLRRPLEGEEVSLGRAGYGNLIGEGGALLELSGDGSQPHSAKAVNDVTVLVIRQPEVAKILALNPALHEQLRSRVKELRLNEQMEMDTRSRAEGVDQRVRLSVGVTEDEFLAMPEAKEEIRKFQVIRQREESDCAAACLTMISNHYGKNFTLGQIVELANLSTANATPSAIITAAEILGYNAAAYAIRYDELKTLRFPGIVGWEGYHYVVVFKVTDKEVHIADPALGLKKLTRAEFEAGWTQATVAGVETDPDTGVFIAFNPTMKFEHLEPPKRPILHFVNYVWPYKKYMGDALVGALILNLLGLASPLFIQVIVDTVVVHKDVSLLNMMLGGMILVAVFRTMTTAAQSLLLAHTTARIDLRMMAEFYRHILSLPMSFFLTRNKGEILARFGENAKIRAIIAGSTVTVVLGTLMIFIYVFMMWAYSGSLTILALLFIPMYVGVTLYFTPKIKEIAQQQFLTNSRSQSFLIESLNGIESIKATANEYFARARWENAFVDNVNMGFQSQKLQLISGSLSQLINLASTVAILWLGAKQVMASEMTVGGLMGFNMLVGQVMAPVQQLVALWNSSQEVSIAIDRVSDVLNVAPEQESVVTVDRIPATLENVQGRITFENVNFSYVSNGKENHVMKDFNLVIETGEHVAFVGASGCGKSTIAKMILGFNVANSGHCNIDGKDIKDLHLDSLRRNIGVVLQDSFLFGGTVAENIALGDPEPNMLAVKEAARLAGADEFIVNYPLGYQTPIGEKGIGISGGQRQRICIARSLYRRPRIMIFDEATSALDNQSEARIQENMKQILAGRTSITIAHRLSTIIDSDFICFIAEGKVAERGAHHELIDPDFLREKGYKGFYYRLAQSQFELPPLQL